MSKDGDQTSVISGSVLDDAVHSGSTKYKEGRMPHLGQPVVYRDGRVFRFCSTEADFVAGEVVAWATCLAAPIDGSLTAAAAGAVSLTLDQTAVQLFGGSAGVIAADRLAEGYLITNDDAGEGYCYKIKGNTAGTDSVSTVITLYDAIKVAVTAASDVALVGPKYRKVVEGAAALRPIGVAVVPTAANSNSREEFFWVQTQGLAAVLIGTGTNVAIGKTMASDASGGLILDAGDENIRIGVAMGTDTTASAKLPVYLNLE